MERKGFKLNTMVTESMVGLMIKKMDYQLKWILDNQNQYSKDLVLAAKEELAKRERPVKSQFTLLLNKIINMWKF